MNAMDRLIDYATRPVPMRTLILRKLLRRWPIGSYEARLRAGAVDRPHYAWCLYFAARQAKALGHKAMTVIEFGVAGGNGLVCLCAHKEAIEQELAIQILAVGVDTGAELPPNGDPR